MVGAEEEATERCSIACSSWLTWEAFYTAQDHLSKHGIAHSGLDPNISVIIDIT